MVGAPVTVVSGAVVVVKSPEHGVELRFAAGRTLVGIGRPGSGSQPHIPVHIGVGSGFSFDTLLFPGYGVPLAEETVGMGGTSQIEGEFADLFVVLSGSSAIVAVNIFDVGRSPQSLAWLTAP